MTDRQTSGGVDLRLVNNHTRPIGGILLSDKWIEFVKRLEKYYARKADQEKTTVDRFRSFGMLNAIPHNTMFKIKGQWYYVTDLPTNEEPRYTARSTNGQTVIHIGQTALELCIEETTED